MKIARCFSFFLIFLIPVLASAQPAADAANEKQRKLSILVDQILADIPSFRLGSNRAFLYAKGGSLICKSEPERSNAMLRAAIGELINAQAIAESEKKPNVQNELLTSQMTRPRVLSTVAVCDADLALQSFYRTRPVAVERSISVGLTKPSKISSGNQNDPQIAQNELNLEQSLMRLAADQNPDRALALLKESLKLGVTLQTFNLLQKLNAKDPDEATRQASIAVENIIQKGFGTAGRPDQQNIQVATAFLSEFMRAKQPADKGLKFDDSQIKTLAEKMFAAFLDPANGNFYFQPQSLIQYAERLSPGNIARIRAREKTLNQQRGGVSYGRGAGDPRIGVLLSSKPTVERLITDAKSFPLESRQQIYFTAANKLADTDNIPAAMALLHENFSDDALTHATDSLNWYYAHRLLNLGKYDEAERMMFDFPESNRNSALLGLAITIFNKNKAENKDAALSILNRVRMLMPDRPSNQNELTQLMQLASAFAKIEADPAFRLAESIVPKLNDLIDASILIGTFQGNGNFQYGELPVGQGMPFPFQFDTSFLPPLAEADFERTARFADQFTRAEMRINLKLLLADHIWSRR
ncbi:MAG: hypothetical protein ABIV48_07000 [Pyrinomonadaceae bacterium]